MSETVELKKIYWEYNYSENELQELLYGSIEQLGGLKRNDLLRRMLDYMNWFDIAKMIDRDFFLNNFTPEFIETLRGDDLKRGLTFVREFLRGKTLSSAR